jgi:hypothetical protein
MPRGNTVLDGNNTSIIVCKHTCRICSGFGRYQANAALHRPYKSTAAEAWYSGSLTDRGDGHILGQAAGGGLINMCMIPQSWQWLQL